MFRDLIFAAMVALKLKTIKADCSPICSASIIYGI